ncbi:MAG TPA: Fe-S protein assembly co-chaperone HscB [Blastocatellia bacterium]|jgi:molecular chaperone HscB|nr:Fe-S protein assembly co-chaperone HscB [Blastocatellia bacterium]
MANAQQTTHSACPHCGAKAGGAHFCVQCKKIQPIDAGADYFSFFGLPRRLRLDEAALEKTFYSLSRQFHPDYFMGASGEERRASVERSSMLNDAYRTLRDRVSRGQYLLSLQGYKEAEKKAPPDLLEEVFDLNIQVEELKAAKKAGDEDEVAEARSSLEEALGGLEGKLREIDDRLYALFGDWDSAHDESAGDEERRRVLDRMSELLSHRSYIRNLVRDIKEEI